MLPSVLPRRRHWPTKMLPQAYGSKFTLTRRIEKRKKMVVGKEGDSSDLIPSAQKRSEMKIWGFYFAFVFAMEKANKFPQICLSHLLS